MAIGLAAMVLQSCASATALQTADTLGAGRTQLALESGYQATIGPGSWTSYPTLGIAGRVGVHDRVDLGGRFGPSGLEAQAKVRLTSDAAVPVLSLVPSAGWVVLDREGMVLRSHQLSLSLLAGMPLPREHLWVCGARIQDGWFFASAGSTHASVHALSLGASAGVALKTPVGRILPELGVLAPVAVVSERHDGLGGAVWGGGKWGLQGTVAVLFGGE